jgi:hypothetical protein
MERMVEQVDLLFIEVLGTQQSRENPTKVCWKSRSEEVSFVDQNSFSHLKSNFLSN